MVKDIVYTGKDSWGDIRTYSLKSELDLYKEIKKDVYNKYKKPMTDSGRLASDEKLLDFYKKNKERFLKNINGEKRVIDDFKEHLKGVKKGEFKASILDSRGNMGASIMRNVAEDELRAKLVIAELKRRGLIDKPVKTKSENAKKSNNMAKQLSCNFSKRGVNSKRASQILQDNKDEYQKILKSEIRKQKGKKDVTKAAKAASRKHKKMSWSQALKKASK